MINVGYEGDGLTLQLKGSRPDIIVLTLAYVEEELMTMKVGQRIIRNLEISIERKEELFNDLGIILKYSPTGKTYDIMKELLEI